jgi:hypothetical protein
MGTPRRKPEPFQRDSIVLCSYQFARSKEPTFDRRRGTWSSSTRPIACGTSTERARSHLRSLAVAPFEGAPDDTASEPPLSSQAGQHHRHFAFGDLQSYRTRYARLGNDTDFPSSKSDSTAVQRTAPAGTEYVKYTNRHARSGVRTDQTSNVLRPLSSYAARDPLLPASQRSRHPDLRLWRLRPTPSQRCSRRRGVTDSVQSLRGYRGLGGSTARRRVGKEAAKLRRS